MSISMWIFIGLIMALMLLFIFSACKLGAESDRQMDEWYAEHYGNQPDEDALEVNG